MITPALGPKIRTAENRNVSEIEISACTFGRRIVAVPLISVSPATTSHGIPGKSRTTSNPAWVTASAPARITDHTYRRARKSTIVYRRRAAVAPEGRTLKSPNPRNLTSQSKR